MNIQDINNQIKALGNSAGCVSDGYHTFDEIYEHRFALMIALCRAKWEMAWKSKMNLDGSFYEGWFLLGIGYAAGDQITYHVPIKYWDMVDDIDELESLEMMRPEFDGHTSRDVIDRLLLLQ